MLAFLFVENSLCRLTCAKGYPGSANEGSMQLSCEHSPTCSMKLFPNDKNSVRLLTTAHARLQKNLYRSSANGVRLQRAVLQAGPALLESSYDSSAVQMLAWVLPLQLPLAETPDRFVRVVTSLAVVSLLHREFARVGATRRSPCSGGDIHSTVRFFISKGQRFSSRMTCSHRVFETCVLGTPHPTLVRSETSRTFQYVLISWRSVCQERAWKRWVKRDDFSEWACCRTTRSGHSLRHRFSVIRAPSWGRAVQLFTRNFCTFTARWLLVPLLQLDDCTPLRC